MSAASLAHAIVSQADSRAEEMRKHIATEFADYFIEVRKSGQQWVIGQWNMIVLKGTHFEVRNKFQLCGELGRGGSSLTFQSFAQIHNFMIFNGYECLSSALDFQNAESVLMKIRVPRAFLQANPRALS